MGAAVEARWRQKQDQLLRLQESGSHTAGLFAAITKTLRLAVQSAAIAAGAFLVLKQEISPGMLIAGSILIGRALQPVEVAVGAEGFIEAKEQYLRLEKFWIQRRRRGRCLCRRSKAESRRIKQR